MRLLGEVIVVAAGIIGGGLLGFKIVEDIEVKQLYEFIKKQRELGNIVVSSQDPRLPSNSTSSTSSTTPTTDTTSKN